MPDTLQVLEPATSNTPDERRDATTYITRHCPDAPHMLAALGLDKETP